MRYSFHFLLLLTGIAFQLAGCDRKGNRVTISINHRPAAGDTVRIFRANMVNLDDIELGKVVLDSTGKGVAQFELNAPVFAYARAEHLATGFFIEPGNDVAIEPPKPKGTLSVSYEGDGAAVNQFINEAGQFRHNLEKWNGKYAIQLEMDEFLKAKDSLQRGYDQLFNKLKSEEKVSGDLLDLLARHIEMSMLLYQYNYALGRDSSEIPDPVRQVVNKMPIDTIALKTGMYDYALIASFFYQHHINNAIYDKNKAMDSDSLDVIFPLLVEEEIKSNKYPKQIEDFLRVKSADCQIRMNGLTPSMIKLAEKLEKEIASGEFKSVIREDIARWGKLGPGKPAPVFSGITPDGKTVSLADLRGKIVYVDIWATWCGYCIDEFPDSKKVQAEFQGNDQVAFLYVSVDRDTLAWKKMVAAGKVPGGAAYAQWPGCA
ncbi:TlpA disulfide reductase family protein [Dyadobacter sp. 676]|uniref:TlpA disulfide reductase family protein n=1 Tax=Dyadobacter sp. 676 TaxID=3088362 RepID=A0AAU8FH33_9BACT